LAASNQVNQVVRWYRGPLPKATKMQLTLAVLLIGFWMVGLLEIFAYLDDRQQMPYASYFLFLGPALTVAGFIILRVGRHEWNDLQRERFKHAHLAFWLTILFIMLAVLAALAFALIYLSNPGMELSIPSWGYGVFAVAVMVALLLEFGTYVLIAFELTGGIGKTVLLAIFAWSGFVSSMVGYTLAKDLDVIVASVQAGTMPLDTINESSSDFKILFAASYFVLSLVYVHAYHRLHDHGETIM